MPNKIFYFFNWWCWLPLGFWYDGIKCAVGWGVWSPHSSDVEDIPSLQRERVQWQLPSRWPVAGCRCHRTTCSTFWCNANEAGVETQVQRTYCVRQMPIVILVSNTCKTLDLLCRNITCLAKISHICEVAIFVQCSPFGTFCWQRNPFVFWIRWQNCSFMGCRNRVWVAVFLGSPGDYYAVELIHEIFCLYQ